MGQGRAEPSSEGWQATAVLMAAPLPQPFFCHEILNRQKSLGLSGSKKHTFEYLGFFELLLSFLFFFF